MKERKIQLTGHPTTHRRKLSTDGEMGAEPVVMSLTLPPKAACTFLKAILSHSELLRITPLKKIFTLILTEIGIHFRTTHKQS